MKTWSSVLAALVAAIALGASAQEPVPGDSLAGLGSVLGELRAGGLVIYFRHVATDKTGPTDEEADLAKCATQRNLSAAGREQAAQIGQAFQALGIPVGSVTTSPFCRCKDTAQLAFGRFSVSDDLYYSIGTDISDTRRLARALRRMLAAAPAAATNAVIVSHTANLREATGIWPRTEGVAYVFRPMPGNRFEAIARVMPGDWGNLARLKTAGKAR